MVNSIFDINNLKSKMNNRNSLLIGSILFRVVTDIIYQYTGFHSELNIVKYLLSWIILLIFVSIIIDLHKKIIFSSMILIFLAYLTIIPFSTMVAFYPYTYNFIFQNTLYWLILFLFYKILPEIKLKRIGIKANYRILYLIVSIFLVTIIYISWRYTGLRITLNIFNVYTLRREALTYNLPIILSYIYAASKSVNPILMLYFLSKKRVVVATFIFIVQLLSFSINGSKTVLLSTILAAFLYWFYKKKYVYIIPWLLSILGIIGGTERLILGKSIIINFIIRRVYFLPNLLNFYYFDFFSQNPPDYFRQSFLRHFGLQSPYTNSIDNMIGGIYFNRPEMGANNGLFSDAYANLGILGIIVMPLIIILALKILDACSKGIDPRIYIISAGMMSFIFISSFFFPILLTHGFIFICIILYLLPRNDCENILKDG